MSTSPEAFSQMSREDLIGTINALEDSLAEAATGLMTEGSAQELAALKVRYEEDVRFYLEQMDGLARDVLRFSGYMNKIPRLIRWWYGC